VDARGDPIEPSRGRGAGVFRGPLTMYLENMEPADHSPPTGASRRSLVGMTLAELEELGQSLALPRYAARQIAGWVYPRHAPSIDAMTDLSLSARAVLAERAEMGAREPDRVTESADGTRKYLYSAAPGRFVEAAGEPPCAFPCRSAARWAASSA
jgi:hypothetical protein